MSYVDVLAKESVRDLIMPVSVEQYHELLASGVVAEKTELIEGVMFRKMTKSPLHEFIGYRLLQFFQTRLDDAYMVRKKAPLTLAFSEPEPDISIVKGNARQFIEHHPEGAELVIEVAVSSVDLDRTKATIYAQAAIPEYWIVLAAEQKLERYRNPTAEGYRLQTVLTLNDAVPTLCGELRLTELFAV